MIHHDSDNNSIAWMAYGSIIGFIKYIHSITLQVDVKSIGNATDYGHAVEAVGVAILAGAGTYLGKEIMRWTINKIKSKTTK